MKNREAIAKKIALVSIIFNVLLTISKILIGWKGHSSALLADGIHSLADVIASVIVYLIIDFASQPADEEHPYGHGKAEVVISGLVGLTLFFVAVYIAIESIMGMFHSIEKPSLLALWMALISFVIKEVLFRYSFRISKRYNSKAIEAMAYDHKADIWASLVAGLGILLVLVGTKYDIAPLLYGDKVATLIVAVLIYRMSHEMMKEAFHILLERSVSEEDLQKYIDVVTTFSSVKRIDRIRAREHGHYVLVDIRLSIPHEQSIKQGHDLCREIKQTLMDTYTNIEEVLIHLNPYFPEDDMS